MGKCLKIFLKVILLVSFLVCILWVFGGSIANWYANLFYKEVLPTNFNKEKFENFREYIKVHRDATLSCNFKNRDRASKTKGYILMLGGNINTRLLQTIALSCFTSYEVLLTLPKNYIENDLGGALQSQTQQTIKALEYYKIPFMIIPSQKGGAQSTKDEAVDTVAFLEGNTADFIILVTDEFHSNRAFGIFSREFREAKIPATLFSIPAPNPYYNRDNWHTKEAGIITYGLEGVKQLLFYLNIAQPKSIEEH